MHSACCIRFARAISAIRRTTAVVFAGVLYLAVGNAQAQSLPGDAVPAFIKSLANSACLNIPLGRQKWNIDHRTNGIDATSDYNDGKSALALQRIGLIEVKTLGSLGTEGTFDVTTKAPIDGIRIRLRNNAVCMQQSDFSEATGMVSRSEPIKGGRSKWDGIIAYVLISNIKSTPLGAAFDRAGGLAAADPTRQFRVLFRQDSFNANWSVVTWDYYHDGRFFGDRVLQKMEQD